MSSQDGSSFFFNFLDLGEFTSTSEGSAFFLTFLALGEIISYFSSASSSVLLDFDFSFLPFFSFCFHGVSIFAMAESDSKSMSPRSFLSITQHKWCRPTGLLYHVEKYWFLYPQGSWQVKQAKTSVTSQKVGSDLFLWQNSLWRTN